MDLKIVLGLITIAGILVSSLLSSAAYFYKNRTEIKKGNRRVLYLLLEIRFSFGVSVINPDRLTDSYLSYYIDKLNARGIPCKRKDIEDIVYNLVSSHIYDMLKISRTDIENRLLVPFGGALMELSNINPILAYRLKGHEKLQKLLDRSKQYILDTSVNFTEEIEEKWLQEASLTAMKKMEEALVADMYETLDNDIIRLSSSCGFGYRKKCKEIVSSRSRATDDFDFKVLDQHLDEFIAILIEAANKANH